ncbi:NAD-dependent epimerase/dehydratase family protein [Sediminibacterium soli]|uniref:NAD-dependent epimerase/dehydratase family protein n=1 Tax=Sediminibacterium soli TaxID=2698829 RepID=UPI00137A8A1E|nr:NAD-dependent epimerase/dehydratase family protein [Sediminibacterium soli]NCI48048.1 NAD-dependent epimerase/dehydratase family protein [Sediminibacterium soli]
MSKKVLITGVAGMIGSRMAEWIVQHQPDYQVIGIDDLSGGYPENVPGKVDFIRMDLVSGDLDSIFSQQRIDYVFHFAAYAAEGLSPFIRRFNYNSNLIATANVVNACIKYEVKRLVFTSSMAVYGIGNPPFSESSVPNPVDPYGVAKFACEMDIRIAGDQHNLDWCIIRPHNVYGRNQNIWDKYRNVLGIWMYQHLHGEGLTIFGDGSQKRAFSYVDDCLEPLWKAAVSEKASRQIINLGSDVETSVLEAARMLKGIIGEEAEIVFLEQRHEVKNAYSTHERATELLDYKDSTPLQEGLAAMWAWAKQQPARERKEWSDYEIDKGMYAFWKK